MGPSAAIESVKYRTIVLTAYGAGLRIAEVCSLEVARERIAAATGAPAPAAEHRAPEDWRELLAALTGVDLSVCPRCQGQMVRHPLPPLVCASAFAPPQPDVDGTARRG